MNLTTQQYLSASPYFAKLKEETEAYRNSFFIQIDQLPELRTFLLSEEVANYILQLGQKYRLNAEEISSISSLIRKIALGEISFQEFLNAIASELQVESRLVNSIAIQIKKDLLDPLSDSNPQNPNSTPMSPESINKNNIINLRK